jgi:hypothetical protein
LDVSVKDGVDLYYGGQGRCCRAHGYLDRSGFDRGLYFKAPAKGRTGCS